MFTGSERTCSINRLKANHKYLGWYKLNMGKYVLLLNWTDQGIKNVKDTIKRAESFKAYLEKRGGKLSDILYTFGQYDIIAIAELPSDEIAMSVSLGTGALGNVRVTTLKAFNLDETRKIVDELK